MKDRRLNAATVSRDTVRVSLLSGNDAIPLHQVDEYRPSRNFIRVGDRVKVKPPIGSSYTGKVTAIWADDAGQVHQMDVFGGKKNRESTRTVYVTQVTRLAQTKGGSTTDA